MNVVISNFWDKWKGRVIPMWKFLDMHMELLVIDWAREEPKMGQIIRHIYVYC